MDRGREGAFVSGGAWRREAVGLGVIGALATVASTVLFFRTQSGAVVLCGALGMTFVAFALLGSRRARRSIEVRLTEIGRDQAETGRAITEYRITADRIVTGDPIVVERRDLRPPDFAPTPETLFWSPPGEAGPLPVQIAGDPTVPRAGESGR
jgi:hypothetical protein